MRAWVARLLSDALRRAAEQDRGAGAPGDAPGAPDAGATESERPEARARRAAADAVLRALCCALAAALRVPLKVASPARVPYAAVATVLKARAGRPEQWSAALWSPRGLDSARTPLSEGCRVVEPQGAPGIQGAPLRHVRRAARATVLCVQRCSQALTGLQACPGRGVRAGRVGEPRACARRAGVCGAGRGAARPDGGRARPAGRAGEGVRARVRPRAALAGRAAAGGAGAVPRDVAAGAAVRACVPAAMW